MLPSAHHINLYFQRRDSDSEDEFGTLSHLRRHHQLWAQVPLEPQALDQLSDLDIGCRGLTAGVHQVLQGQEGLWILHRQPLREKTRICIPGTKVYFSAVPAGKDSPVSHIATAVSLIHCKMPFDNDVGKIVETAKDALKKIFEKPEFADLKSVKSD